MIPVYRKRFVLFQEYIKNRNIKNTTYNSSTKIATSSPKNTSAISSSPKKGEGKSYCKTLS